MAMDNNEVTIREVSTTFPLLISLSWLSLRRGMFQYLNKLQKQR